MNTVRAAQATPETGASVGRYLWLGAAAAILGVFVALREHIPWIDRYPRKWVIPLKDWINALFEWLGYDLAFGSVQFRDITRGFAWLLEWPLAWSEALFIKGIPALEIMALPWVTVVGLVAIVGHYIAGWRTALIGGGCFLYLALFSVWSPSMETFAMVAMTVPFAAGTGLLLGIWAARSKRIETVLTPLFDVMQSTPAFAYLVPVIVLFGFGQVPAMIATGVFATPPMARCVILGLRTVPGEIMEAGRMAGCNSRQLLWRVQIPSAHQTIMVGVNQAIMQTLAMAVIASLIGASGLGHNLLTSLDTLRLGQALEQGVAIVVIAVALDRLSQAYAVKAPVHINRAAPFWQRRPHLVLGAVFALVTIALALIFPPLRMLPDSWTITTAPMWDAGIDWITFYWYEPLQGFRNTLLLYVLIPIRNFYLWFPWPAVVGLVGLLGWRLGGWRMGLLVGALIAFPAVTGFWKPAMITAYMISSAVLICIVVGFPIGLWASRSDRVSALVITMCDTLQTFPSFIYLIPVVMLFKVGDVAAIMAVLAFAIVPMIRYTNLGLRRVPRPTVEAATAIGTTRRQRLWKVEMPIAIPEIMLGVNQTIFMALFMVAITALIGTKDLGAEINRARSDADTGTALVAGFCIAFMGIAADRLINTWSRKRKAQLGLE
jgi:glycine betaine/proline transport system permease protein